MSITTHKVIGMSCDHCVNAVTQEVTAIDGVTAVSVDLSAGEVAVTSDSELDLAEFAAAIDEAGFEVATQ